MLRRYREFPSDHVAARNVDVWVPPEYEEASSRRFPVIYMHDGQNLFDPQSSFIGVDWGIDETMRELTAALSTTEPPAVAYAVRSIGRLLTEEPRELLSEV